MWPAGIGLLAAVVLGYLTMPTAWADALPDYRPRGSTVNHIALLDACAAGDLEAVRRALTRGADPTWIVPDGYQHSRAFGPAALLVASRGQPDIMEPILVQRPELVKTYGCTLLDHTIEALADKTDRAESARYERIIKLLIDRKVDVTRPDLEGYTPLMVATRFGQLAVVRLLLGAGANARAKSNNGETAWTLARSPTHPRPEHEAIARLLDQNLAKP